jgi:hypothetical protein
MAQFADRCASRWGDRERLNTLLVQGFASVPHCAFLYGVDCDAVELCDNLGPSGAVADHFGRDRSQRPYMPFRYRTLDHEALTDPDICLVYPPRPYPAGALIHQEDIGRILATMRALRFADQTFYLRAASINQLNGMVSLTLSCDGSHYMPYMEFLLQDVGFWL